MIGKEVQREKKDGEVVGDVRGTEKGKGFDMKREKEE